MVEAAKVGQRVWAYDGRCIPGCYRCVMASLHRTSIPHPSLDPPRPRQRSALVARTHRFRPAEPCVRVPFRPPLSSSPWLESLQAR